MYLFEEHREHNAVHQFRQPEEAPYRDIKVDVWAKDFDSKQYKERVLSDLFDDIQHSLVAYYLCRKGVQPTTRVLVAHQTQTRSLILGNTEYRSRDNGLIYTREVSHD